MTKGQNKGTLMVQGTTSDAGKSTLVAGLCRALVRKKHSVAPFKPQNMALNSAVTEDGGEIGRAQALQAVACRLKPTVHMNPILLKPTTDQGAQVIVQGKALTNMQAQQYHGYKKVAKEAVFDSYQKLGSQYDWIMVEGAGSPAEINLRHNDIANMGFAEEADCPVIIVADIDRGGVFAHLVGTLDLLTPSEQNRVIGFVINRFRGDISLLESGLDWLEERTGKPVLGVLPYLHGLYIDAEDGVNPIAKADFNNQENETSSKRLQIVIPGFPRISNHTDFDPLRLHPQVDVHYIRENEPIPAADLIILPGTKSVIQDLEWLKKRGWESVIKKHLRYGGKLIGICGGYQMLGLDIKDPDSIESEIKHASGLSLIELTTTLFPEKQLTQVQGHIHLKINNQNPSELSVPVKGYEIHAGVSTGSALSNSPINLSNGVSEGVISDDNQILGTYLHGLFDQPEALEALLTWAGVKKVVSLDYDALRQDSLEQLADAVETSIDLDNLMQRILEFTNQ